MKDSKNTLNMNPLTSSWIQMDHIYNRNKVKVLSVLWPVFIDEWLFPATTLL